MEVPERLVGFLPERNAHEAFHGQILGLGLLAGPQQSTEFTEILVGALVGVVVRSALPDGIFVELDALLGDAAEYHGAESALTDGERFGPLGGGFVVPE